ncbi:MAG: nicotinate-nucleotide adenylyltransferase [Dehalococcoidales bacterium]
MKLGVLGGTFDPVHLAHIAVAVAARDALELDRVILVPAGQPMSKVNQPITAAEHRLKMLRLAVKGKKGLEVSTIETERPGPSYTVDTVSDLKKQYGTKAQIFFILGCDSLAQLPEWREPARLAAMCRLVAVPRPGCTRPNMQALEQKIPGITKSVIFLDKPNIDISATDVRDAALRGKSIDHLVPGPVTDYIKEHKLYLPAGGKP